MIKILIIEDEISIQKLLKYDLEKEGFDVTIIGNGIKGYQEAKKDIYDLILLDIMLPDMNGVEILKKLTSKKIKAYIIMLTALGEEIDKITGLDSGADDYITKPFSPRELISRIKAVLRRKDVKKKNILEYQNIVIDCDKQIALVNGEQLDLTVKEFQLLVYLLEHIGKVLSRDILLENLWGFSYDGDTRIVDVHIFKLREKLAQSNLKIKTKRGIGYMIEEDN